jgi:signal transduction histidine kinase
MIESDTPVAATAATGSPGELLRFGQLLTSISSRFIDLPPGRIDEAINDGLRRIVGTLRIDRSTLSMVDPNTGRFHPTHSWAAPRFMPVPTTVWSRTYPWALDRFRAGLPVVFASLDELPPEAALDRASYASLGLCSHVGIPVMVSGAFLAVLGFDALRAECAWPDNLVARMRLLGDIFGSALDRKRVQDRIDELLTFERLLADLSASLVGTPGSDLDAEVNAALRAVGTLLEVDGCVLWDLTRAPGQVIATHEWVAEGAAPPPRKIRAADVPWIMEAVVAGNIVNVTGNTDSAPHAASDIAVLRRSGVRALLAIPLRARDAVAGALTLSCTRDVRIWPDEFVPRLQVFGKMLSNALAHRDAERSAQRANAETAQFRERLAHLARVDAVGAMTAAVAHEVNQPLMAIKNYALAGRRRVAGDGPVDRAKLDELLEKIGGHAALAGEVLDRLRSMVRRRDTQEVDIDPAELMRSAAKLVEMESRIRDVRVETVIAPDLPRGLGDEVQIQQVVLNLALNAMEAMAATPTHARVLRLEAAVASDDGILIRVADRGPGIASSDEEKVFEPFFTTKSTGLGIGLSICRSIVEAHGGRLWHDPHPGGGAVFQFTLPNATDGD